MKWEQVFLSTPKHLIFQDGIEALVSYYSREIQDRNTGGLCLLISKEQELYLADAVDDSQTVSEPHIFTVFGSDLNKVFICGGSIAYRVNTSSEVECSIKLNRIRDHEEYWISRLEHTDFGLIVVYEGGLFLLNEELQIQWHIKKLYNDFFAGIEGNIIKFLRDHEEEWIVNINTGDATTRQGT